MAKQKIKGAPAAEINRAARTVKVKAYVRQIKSGTNCKDCNKDPSTKIMCVTEMITRRLGIARIKTEIAKCELVCANCHRIRTFCEVASA